MRHARLGARLLGLDGQRACGSPTTTSTATRPASPATRCPRPATPASPPTAPRSTTTTSTRTTSTSTSQNSPVKPLVAVPVGTGIIYAGMNDARVHDNWFFDNWRDGAMLFAVPDALTSDGGAEGDVVPGVSCPGAPASGVSTSCGNHYFNNKMGQVPPGFKFPAALDQFGVPHGDRGCPDAAQRQRLLVGRVHVQHRRTAGTATPGPTAQPPASPAPARRAARPGSRRTHARLRRRHGPAEQRGRRRHRQGRPTSSTAPMGPDEDTGPLDCDWWARRRGRERAAAAQAQSRGSAAAARASREPRRAERLRQRMADAGR